MIELVGIRYGVGSRTAVATSCLAVAAGVSYSLFIIRFALPWFGVHSPGVLRLTESSWAVCAMTSLLIAIVIFCSMAFAPKERIATSADDATGHLPGGRLISDMWAWFDVVPLSMGLAISGLTQVNEWSSRSVVSNVTMCATALLMATHVNTLRRLAQEMRGTRFPDSQWRTPNGLDGPDGTRRRRIAAMVGVVSFVVLLTLYTLYQAIEVTAHGLTHMTDPSEPAGPDFLHLCALPSGAVVFLALAAVCQARA